MIDHHVHLFSEGSRAVYAEVTKSEVPPLTSAELLPVLDEAHVERAAVLSVAYFFECPDYDVDRASLPGENDWVRQEVERHPDRLVGFFSVNPLADGALDEIERCASSFTGLKLHLANSCVDLLRAEDLARLADVFAAADRHGLVLLVHMRTRNPAYGASDAEAFRAEVLPHAASVPVQLAHMAGWGGYDEGTDAALGALADSAMYFDLSDAVLREDEPHMHERLAARLKALPAERVLFGTDWPVRTPATYVDDLMEMLPDAEAHFGSCAPWMSRA